MAERAPPLTTTRVAFGCLPNLLRTILVRLLQDASDVKLVGETSDPQGLQALLANAKADVLVTSAKGVASSAQCEALLREFAPLRVLVMQGEGRQADLHWLEFHSRSQRDLSSTDLMSLLRSRALEVGS